MKTFYLTVLGALALGTVQAEPDRPQHLIAIEVEKPPQQNGITKHVQIGERKELPQEEHVQVGERVAEPVREPVGSRKETHVCVECQRRIVPVRRPAFHGRVPIGSPIPRYSQGIVVYPYAPLPPEPVMVHPPCRHCHPRADFSFSWNFWR